MSVTVHVPSQAGRPAIEARPGRFASLFPAAAYRRLTPSAGLLAGAAIAAGTVISLLRTTGTGALQSIWEEDARDVLDGALNTAGWGAVVKPVSGYFVVGPRLLGELATLFPLSWAAAVLSVSAALITALLALLVYCASEPFFRSPGWGRLARGALSVPVLVASVAENRFTEVYNRPVCLHFFAAYALFWALLWTPATTRGRVAAMTTAGLTGVSTILVVGFLPLAAFRLTARRDRWSGWLFATVAAGSLLQLLGLWTGLTSRQGSAVGHPDLYWLLRTFAGWGLPTSVFGFRATSGLGGAFLAPGLAHNWGVVILAWLMVAAVILVSVVGARRGFLRPRWTLATAAAVSGVWLYALTAVANGAIAYRYLVPVQLLFVAAAVALLRPGRVEPTGSGGAGSGGAGVWRGRVWRGRVWRGRVWRGRGGRTG